jgi:hypothetical protein
MKFRLNAKKTYLTPGLKTSCYNKRLLKYLKTQTKSKIIHNYYKSYSKTLKKAFQMSKKLVHSYKYSNSINKSKAMWQIINQETNHRPRTLKQNIALKDKQTLHHNPKIIANCFNKYFTTISNVQTPSVNTNTIINTINDSLYLHLVELNETYNILRNLKNKNSFGIDEIPPRLIKMCAEELTLPYTQLINQSFLEGCFPDSLKVSLVKPIYKKGDKTDANNYRPIALPTTSTKILETAMSKRLISFLDKNKAISDTQFGFRKNKTTILAIYKYIQKILNIINKKEYAVGLLLDMSKAYDKVNYKILLDKLYGLGIRGQAFDWFKSYLENRSQYVEVEYTDFVSGCIEHARSDSVPVTGSIPQGSVLGCILFLVYVNDLPQSFSFDSVSFADDVSIILACTNVNSLTKDLDSLLDSITHWLNKNNLQLNLNKTKLIQFKPYQKSALEINYTYKTQKLETVNSITMLGIDIDTHITWKPHIEKLCSRLSSFTYALGRLKRVTNTKIALSAYYAYAQSRLSYGIILWGNCSNIQAVFALQKKCIRIITNIKQTDSCKPHFRDLKIMTVPCLYILEACKFIKKHIELYSPIKIVRRNNRYQNKLKLPFSKLKLYSSAPHSMLIKIYNHIPNQIKSINKTTIFEKHLKQFLILKSYYSISEFFEDNLDTYNVVQQ